ncbi:MAG: hypothetical protein M1814_004125 [Vezdaea aestivalis]|nr:MAG: hypothetical protein M1814_004125 [Vezdaea aestivalis]
MSSSRQSSRQRSSSAISTHSDVANRTAASSSPLNAISQSASQLTSDEQNRGDPPSYQNGIRAAAPTLHVSSPVASPHPNNPPSHPPWAYASSPLRPRAQTAAEVGFGQPQNTYRPTPRAPANMQAPMPYQPGQRLASTPVDPSRQQYIPAPPPLPMSPPVSQQHMMTLPPPPPRPHPSSIPPPPGPPPGSSHGMQPGWQSSWGRTHDRDRPSILPPPPPLPIGMNQSHVTYNPSQTYGAHPGTPLTNAPQPAFEVSATYIPQGDSFGPGVGIPSLTPSRPYEQPQAYARTDGTDYTTSVDHSRQLYATYNNDPTYEETYRSYKGPVSSNTRPMNMVPSYRDAPDHTSPNLSAASMQTSAARLGPAEMSTNGTLHRQTGSNSSNTPMSPNDISQFWTMSRVVEWLQTNSFSVNWQETFKTLKVQGSDFLELGRGNNGRGNFSMMHNHIYPELAKSCTASGIGWDQTREREEAKRMRRLIRKITDDITAFNPSRSAKRDSSQNAPQSAVSENGTESSPNLNTLRTPTTAGAEDDSPGHQGLTSFPPPAASGRPPTSKTKAYPPTTPSSDVSESTAIKQNRTGFSKSILNPIGDGSSSRKQSPGPSSDSFAKPGGLRSESQRPFADSSSQGNSPVPSQPLPTPPITASAMALSPRGGHAKSNSTDSVSHAFRLNDSKKSGQENSRSGTNDSGTPKEHRTGLFNRLRGKKAKGHDAATQPSPDEPTIDSPTSPVSFRQGLGLTGPNAPFARYDRNGSDSSLDKPASAGPEHTTFSFGHFRGRAPTRASTSRRYVLATSDGVNFRLIDITEADSADGMRNLICQSLGIADSDFSEIYATEPGATEHTEKFSDKALMAIRKHKVDSPTPMMLFVRNPSASAISGPQAASQFSNALLNPSQKDYAQRALPSPPIIASGLMEAVNDASYGRVQPSSHSPSTLKPPELAPPSNASQNDPNDSRSQLRNRLLSSGHAGGTLNEADREALFREAANEQRRVAEKQYQANKKNLRLKSVPKEGENGNVGLKRPGVIDFDEPRISPFEDRKHDWKPHRKAPPPPAESNTLIKANSLSKKTGHQSRLSMTSLSDDQEKRTSGESFGDLMQEGRRKAFAATPSLSSGIGAAIANAGKLGANIGAPSPPVLGQEASDKPRRGLASVDWGQSGSGRNSPSSPTHTWGKGTLFKIPNYTKEPDNDQAPPPRPDLNVSIPENRALSNVRKVGRKGSPELSPSSVHPSMSIRRSYGPTHDFKEADIQFASSPQVTQESSADDDSDDGLFAIPIQGSVETKKPTQVPDLSGEDTANDSAGSRSGRPTLSVDTKRAKIKGSRKSVAFKSPPPSAEFNESAPESLRTNSSSTAGTNTGTGDSTVYTPVSTFAAGSGSSSAAAQLTPEAEDTPPLPRRPKPRQAGSADSANWSARSPSDSRDIRDNRRESFASRDDVWASRPPGEVLIGHLDDFFPGLDLDQPIVEENAANSTSPPSSPSAGGKTGLPPMPNFPSAFAGMQRSSTPMSLASGDDSDAGASDRRVGDKSIANVAQRNIRRSGGAGLSRMKSIREVAKGAHEANRKRFTAPSQASKAETIQRRKSTKMFGANIVQINPGRGERISRPPDVPQDNLPKRQATFKWFKGQLIGKGTFGRVYLGMNATTGEFLAVKQVEVSRAAGQDKEKIKEMVAALDQEIDTMQHLDHNNIVQYLGCERKEYSISIFLEYISGGSVGSCLHKHGKFEESIVRSLTRQTLDGLAYLHSESILHRDLKADNILLDLDGTCKISDFGISKKTDNIYGNDVTNSMQGSVFWMAPEVIRSEGVGYSAKVDVWSLGCCVLEMFHGKRPWSKEEAIGAIYKLGSLEQAPPIPDEVSDVVSPYAVAFMADCFTIDATERPQAVTLLKEHPFCKFDAEYNFLDTELYAKIRTAYHS